MSNPSAAFQLQKALYIALENNVTLTTALGGMKIYDRAPEDITYPYVSFGTLTIRDGATASEEGTDCRFTLHIWSRSNGKKQCFELMHEISLALHDQNVALDEDNLINLRLEFSDVGQDPDRLTFHGVMRFRAYIDTPIQ